MKKQLLLFVMFLLPLVASADAIDIDGVYYNLDTDAKTAEVAKHPNNYSGSVIIPSLVKYEGVEYVVTSIGNSAFGRCPDLISVVIGKNVTAIGSSAFTRGKLKNVWSLMETPPAIASNTFSQNTNATLHVPASSLEAYQNADVWKTSFVDIVAMDGNLLNDNPIAFADANVKALCVANWDTNGNGELSEMEAFVVTDLKDVFSQNQTITSFDELQYFENVSSLGEYEFKDCSNLTSVHIPSGVSSLGSEAFSGCNSLMNVWVYSQTPPDIISTSFTNSGNATLHVPASSLVAYSKASFWNWFLYIVAINESNNTIVFADPNVKALCVANWDINGDGELNEMEASMVTDLKGVFSQNESITSFDELVYFVSLQNIGDNEFTGCKNLTSISIPCNVTSIGNMDTYSTNEAFSECTNLIKVEVHCNAIVSNDYPDYRGGFNRIFGSQVEEYILGDEITGIGANAFYGAVNMKSIKISDNVTRIGRRAFEWCYGGLSSITLPTSLREISEYAFHGCSLLRSITIPANLESIGEFAFESCGSLSRVYCLAKQIPTSNYSTPVFFGTNYQKGILHVPANLIDAYRNSEQWNGFGNIIALESAVDELYYNFDDNAKTAEVISVTQDLGGTFVLPSTINHNEGQYNVTGIGSSAFSGCYNLTSITIPNSVKSIGDDAFSGCIGLTSAVLGEGVASIGESAFYGCTSLLSVVIPSSVASIGESGFSNCPALISMKVENGNAAYDSRENCNAIIETATNTLLFGCQKTVIPEDVEKIGIEAFNNCYSLTSINIPEGVTEIGGQAFQGCTALTSIAIPASVTAIGEWAFFGCSGLTAVYITNLAAWCSFDFSDLYGNFTNPIRYAQHLYLNGKEVKELVIPEGVPSIGHCTFQGLTDLTSVVIPSSVTSIGKDPFSGCPSITNVYCYAEQVPESKYLESDYYYYSMWNSYSFQNVTLHVPAGSIEDYRNNQYWSVFGNIVALTEEDPKPTGIINVSNDVMPSQRYYSLDGKHIVTPQRGLNIVKMKDGTTRKVLVK